MGLGQINGSVEVVVATKYYTGTDTLQSGYALCYDTAASATATDEKTRLGQAVLKPATAHLKAFAGIVHPSSAGKTGPCFVDIIVPRRGDIIQAWTNVNQTAFTTALSVTNAGGYALVADTDATFNDQHIGLAAVTVDTSGTAALNYVRFA